MWHDVMIISSTHHRSNYNNPLQPQEPLQIICALRGTVAGVVYCQRSGSPDVFLHKCFLTIYAVQHLILHRKVKSFLLARLYSALHLDIHFELRLFFLFLQQLYSLWSLQQKKKRLNNRHRRTWYQNVLTSASRTTLQTLWRPFLQSFKPPDNFSGPSKSPCFWLGCFPSFSSLDSFGSGLKGFAWWSSESWLSL